MSLLLKFTFKVSTFRTFNIATKMQITITRFGFNPSGWQTIIQQACLKTVEEESEKDKSAGLKNWEEGKENWIKKHQLK